MQHLFDRNESLGWFFLLASRVFFSHHRRERWGRHNAKLADVSGGSNDVGPIFGGALGREEEAKERLGECGSDFGEIGVPVASLCRDFDSLAAS